MPFTHSYSASAIAARGTRQDRSGSNASGSGGGNGIHILNSDSSSSFDVSSSRYQSSAQSAPANESPSASEHDFSARPRLFSSGRKSPVPFRRFRRLSSSNSLSIATAPPVLDASQSFDSQQTQSDSSAVERADTQIPPYPPTAQRPASIAPLHTLRTAPPPLPSSSTKPIFQRPKRTKSSSISILSTGLGLRSRDSSHLDPASDPDVRRRHRKSASLSGSDADFSSSTLDSRRAATPQPGLRAASPSPSLSESLYSSLHEPRPQSPAFTVNSSSHKSKQHKQAWYQAQQKTIELDNPYNRGAPHPNSDTAKLFPLNVAVSDSVSQRGLSSPADSRSPQPAVETFLSEEEMLAAGIHIIRRRDNVDAPQVSPSSKDSPGLATPRPHDQATMPTMPPRLYGSDHPDFLEFIDSPVDVKQSGPLIEQLIDPSLASASMQRALSHSRNKSSTGSLSVSSGSSTDYLPQSASNPDDVLSLNNGSTASLSSGSKHSFSFAKLRRAGSKQSNVAGSSRPSTANSSSEDISNSRHFLFPSRSQTKPQEQHQSRTQQQTQHQQQQHAVSSSGGGGVPGYLTPGPASSASPFLNKHSATVGRASRSIGAGATAKNGLAQVINTSGSGAATVGPSSFAANPYHAAAGNGVPPPKPPKPKPSLLAAFPRSSGNNSNAMLGSISAPTTANRSDNAHPNSMLQPPGSAGTPNGLYRNIAHSRSQEAVAEARLDAEALRVSAGTPLPPPPRRLNGAHGAYAQHSSTAMGRTISGSGGSGVVGALGHVGQLGAAVGRKGWDFMKTLQSSSNASGVVAASGRGGGAGYRPAGSFNGAVTAAAENEPTRRWLMLLDGSDSGMGHGRTTSGCVFGAPLKDAVLRSRLSSLASDPSLGSKNDDDDDDHLGVPDFGKQFSANFLESPRVTPRASVAADAKNEPLSKEEARHLFLPRIVVRCIESLEKWGPSEEGIYRISGRSSHTSKLRSYFADPRNDLHLVDISPADLDINSVCSLLKSYLRELPDPLIPLAQSQTLDQAVARLLANTGDVSAPVAAAVGGAVGGASGSGAKITEARAASIEPAEAAEALGPLMRQLPVYNWYLLRELTDHLGMLAQPEVVARTKMPISNLTLVLAPTVSISLPLLQVLVRHREVVFAGAAPSDDYAAVAAASVAAVGASSIVSPELKSKPLQRQLPQQQQQQQLPLQPRRPQAPPKPAKPEKLGSPSSRLPVMVRKRASSMGLAALLSSPTRKTAAAAEEATQREHRRTPSATPSIELPAYLAEAAASRPASPSPSPASPSMSVHDPYERPSTSLGHFAELSPSRPSHSTLDRDRFGGSRDAALRFNALALDDDDHQQQRRTSSGKNATPIARYYARMREEAERERGQHDGEEDRDGAKTPLALPSSSSVNSIATSRYTADTGETSLPTSSSSTSVARSGRTSALDRPRPPTSSSASFFAGRSRRQDSVNGLNAFAKSSIPESVQNEQGEVGGTKPLNIVKRAGGGGSAEERGKVRDQIARYLTSGPGRV